MARPFQDETLRGNMAESLARRPSIAMATTSTPAPGQFQGRAKLPGACVIEVDRLVPDPDQPRKTFTEDSIEQLAGSFKGRGQLVPILVRWSPEANHYTIVDGERRYRAALRAGLASLAAVDVTNASPEDVLEIQLVTNALREDVQPVEQARAWQRLMDMKKLTHRELASRLGYDHSTITRSLGLLNLPESIQALVDAGEIKAQTGYELSRLKDPVEQAQLAEGAKTGTLRRDDIREKVAERKASSRPGKGRGGAKPRPRPLPSERILKTPGGLKVVVAGRKGFDVHAWAEALRNALEQVEASLEAECKEGATGEQVEASRREGRA